MEMSNKARKFRTLIPTVIMVVLAAVLVVIAYAKGQGQHIEGTKLALGMTVSVLPLLFAAFLVAGMVQVLLPQELISKWIGAEAGIRGIFVGTVAGALAPGGPYVSLPIAATLLHAGAGVGAYRCHRLHADLLRPLA